jgi:hypothetical protein
MVEVSGMSTIANSNPNEGGSFAYDEDTLRSLVTKWVEIADHYLSSHYRTDLGSMEPPGLDAASEALAKAVNTSGNKYRAYLVDNYWYCVRQAQLCQTALDNYLGVEHHNVLEMSKFQQPDAGPQPGI